MQKDCLRMGVLGGTFDPIHMGHLIMAETVRSQCKLDQILFIPTGDPPHKQDQRVCAPIHRYVMTELATASNPYFQVSSVEIERPGLSYTIDTIPWLIDHYGPKLELFYIIGEDAVQHLLTWKDFEQLLALCCFVVVNRPGTTGSLENLLTKFGEDDQKFITAAIPQIAISATEIRERLSRGNSIRYLVPPSVEAYIYKHRLYV